MNALFPHKNAYLSIGRQRLQQIERQMLRTTTAFIRGGGFGIFRGATSRWISETRHVGWMNIGYLIAIVGERMVVVKPNLEQFSIEYERLVAREYWVGNCDCDHT